MESSYTHIILRISNRIESDYRDCLFTTDQVSPSIVEQNNYLPFGTRLPLTDPAYDFGNRWRYAAKEEQRFGLTDLGLLDFGARMYDPFTARWTAVDPMAAKAGDKIGAVSFSSDGEYADYYLNFRGYSSNNGIAGSYV